MGIGFKDSEEYLKQAHKFKLGFLPTEQSHPETWLLSDYAKNDISQGIEVLKQLDINVLSVLQSKQKQAHELSITIKKVFSGGGKVYLFGCGATGRLSLLIESIWNQLYPNKVGQVMSFMSGGDIALVQSVEGFEDFTDYGARQLTDMGFTEKDLLICSTEGGETPIVIGAALKSLEISNYKTYFLYCNPTDLLVNNIERSKHIIKHEKVKSIELFCGPMGVAGSTRMQASSVLQAFICMSLFFEGESEKIQELDQFKQFFSECNLDFLKKFIELESGIYVSFNRITYNVDPALALNVFTDTTERAPTFSMKPFEHPEHMTEPLSLCYINVNGSANAEDAWEKLLYRKPRALTWADEIDRVSHEYLKGFDFSFKAVEKRNKLAPSPHSFTISNLESAIGWKLNDHSYEIKHGKEMHSVWRQLLLKMILNIHSTLIMGRLNRYQNNLMTWVSPSNGKLVDRTARYINYFLKEKNIDLSYEEIVQEIFAINLKKDRSMVLEIVKQIEDKHAVF